MPILDQTVTVSRWTRIGFGVLTALLVAFGSRTAYLCFRYLSNDPATKRFQVETATLWFIVVALALSVVRSTLTPDSRSDRRGGSVLQYSFWLFSAAALYWPALALGLLSDDFLLADRAYRFAIGSFNAEAFRPFPLAVWGAILHLGGGAVALHALNIVLHGTNAFLTTRLVRPLVRNRIIAFVAGALMLTMPVLVEPVVWCSGIFDVAATTFVLLAVLTGRDYDDGGIGARVRFFLFSVAGLLSKETAVVLPVLVAVDALIRQSRSRRLYQDVAVVFGGMAVVSAVRFAFASASVKRRLSKYLVQRWVFGTIGGLAVPWHAEVIAAHPWIGVAVTWMQIVLLAGFSLRITDRSSRRLFYGMSSWVLIGTLPAITFFFIGPDLQSSRYLYLATIGWAGLVVAMMDWHGARRPHPGISAALTIALIPFTVYGVRQHLGPWRAAALTRDKFERAAAENAQLMACRTIAIRNPPDSIRGAYVLRNGAVEALQRDVGFHGEAGTATAACSFTWDPDAEVFRSSTQ